jgi:hypothetical protein
MTFLLRASSFALACPVCFGESNSPMASAANLSILVMLVIVAGMLVAFASFFIYLMRRARLANLASFTGDDARPHEGTASC